MSTRSGLLRTGSAVTKPEQGRRTVREELLKKLIGQIVSGDIAEGSLLPNEAELSEVYGVSRTSLREAMQYLSALGMVRSLAAEVGPFGITVNAVAPGIIETPQTLDSVNSLGATGIAETGRTQPVRRIGKPDDIAAAYHFLASDDASFVTGHTLLVDGGRMLIRG